MKPIKNKSILNTPVAIIGMGGLFPKSSGLKEYWRLLSHGKDGITGIPETHWSPEDYYDGDTHKPDHIYCKRGGFLSPVLFDPAEFGIPPSTLEATDTSQLLSLLTCKMALENAGYGRDRAFNRDRTSVILGVTGTQELALPLSARLGYPKWRRALEDSGISAGKTDEILERLSNSYVQWQENSFPGLLGNVVAGRICNRLDLGGTNCVVDAACASSMSALHLSLLELLAGRSDMVLTGGVDTLNDIFMHMCFARTHTLSPTGDAKPFSKDADGTVLGEGVGILVLKRLEDAEKDGDRIYAVIKSLGSSSDGKSQSIYAPRAEGQAKALRMAYETADINPTTIELLEAHGTGTRVGDLVEFQALNQVFSESHQNGNRCALGSVKSMIGHTKAAAGAAGIIKAALSLYHKVLPPTLKAEEPDPNLRINESPFYLNTKTRPWLSRKRHPRRSGVSAFGFGGSNFHVVLEEYSQNKAEISWDGSVDIVALSDSSPNNLAKRLMDFKKAIDGGLLYHEFALKASESRFDFSHEDPYRILVVIEEASDAPNGLPSNISEIFSAAIATLEAKGSKNVLYEKNIFYGSAAKAGQIAFVFPGQGSQYIDMGRDLLCTFPEALKVLEQANEKYETFGCLSDLIFPLAVPTQEKKQTREETLRRTDIAQPAIGAISLAMLKILEQFGVKPDVTGGHSFGELTALCAAGWINDDTFFDLSIARGNLMARACRKEGQPVGAMLAVNAPLQEIDALVNDLNSNVILANRNTPVQGVLSGPADEIARAETECKNREYRTKKLPVAAAFHSHLIKNAQKPFLDLVKKIDIAGSKIPVFSNTTGKAYPADPDNAKQLLGKQLARPVNFNGEIENLYNMGARLFVEVGPRSVLTGLVKSILDGRSYNAVALDPSSGKKFGLTDLAQALCQIAALGYPVELRQWEHPATKTRKQLMSIPISGANFRDQRKDDRGQKTEDGGWKTENGKPKTEVRDQRAAEDERRTEASGREMEVAGRKTEDRGRKAKCRELQTAENRHTMKDNQHKQPDFISDALRVVQEGLKSMQSLHRQTAETHQKFLETQTQAARTLQQMMKKTQRLTEASLGLKPANMIKVSDAPELDSTLTFPVKIPEDSSIQPVVEPEMEPVDEVTKPLPSNIHQELKDTMLEVVSRLTGYPAEMLGMDMDIEADLGIDSIKRVEILSSLEETMPHLPPVSPEIMGTLKTLGQIAEYLAGATSNAIPQPVLEAVCSGAPSRAPECELQPISDHLSENIERRIVSITEQPAFQGETLSIPSGRKVYITDDKTGLSHAIAEEFVSFEIEAIVVSADRLKDPIDLPKAAGLVIIPNPDSELETSDLKDAFVLAKQVAPDLLASAGRGGAIFSTVTRLDGAFGFIGREFHNPVQGGLAGLAKTAAIEWENVCCRAIDIQPDWKEINAIARAVVRELLNPDPQEPVEIGLAPESRLLLELASAPYPATLSIELELNPENVVVITGGAKGVTASVVCAMAKYTRPVFVLIGRSPHPVPEPDWLLALSDEAEIKKAIFEYEFKENAASPKQIEKVFKKHMANREIMKNLAKIKETGATVLYYSVDVRDPIEVGRILGEVRSAYGSIRGIIHGAGVLEDRYIIDKTPEQFEKVLDTKVKGLQVLLEATQQDPLKYLVLFSSVSARFGNKGQVDYAMANEVLNKIAQYEAITRPDCRVVSINWGPWDGGMVSPALKREFTRNKIGLIPMDAGPMYMLQEMLGNHRSPVEVVIGASIRPAKVNTAPPIATPEESKTSKKNEDLALTFSREVDVERYPILGSHILDGKPVVPFALMTEWLGHGALHENPGLLLYGIDDMRLLQGIKIDKGKKMIRLLSGKAKKTGLVYEVDVEIRDGIKDGEEVIHSKAKAILADKPLQPPVYDPSAVFESKVYHRGMDEVYEKILFHGLELRGIKEITRYSDKGMVARISTAPSPAKWMNEPLRSKWIGDPLVLDCAFQMAIIWTFEAKGLASLPSYYASYRQYGDSFPAEGVTAVMEVQEAARHKIRCDYTFLNQDNTVMARLEGYEAIMDPSLLKAFKPGETS